MHHFMACPADRLTEFLRIAETLRPRHPDKVPIRFGYLES
jgi:hypothetical protein